MMAKKRAKTLLANLIRHFDMRKVKGSTDLTSVKKPNKKSKKQKYLVYKYSRC